MFAAYSEWLLARNFHALRSNVTSESFASLKGPVLIYSNHSSWWDPLVFLFLAKHLFPGYAGFGPMDAIALQKYSFMKRLGIFGIEPGTLSGARRFLQVCGDLLARPQVMLWVTAQGRFADPRLRPLILQPGIAHLAKRLPGLTMIPLAIEYPFWVERCPEIVVQFGQPAEPAEWLELMGNDMLVWQTATLNLAMDQLAEKVITQNPESFNTLLCGSEGVGGVFDAFKQFKASLTGQNYSKAHGDVVHDSDN